MDAAVERARRALALDPEDPTAREELARALLRTGQRIEALELLGIRWEVDPAALLARVRLAQRGSPVGLDELEATVAGDLARLDPFALLRAFPRTQGGLLRLNTTRALRRYPIYEAGYQFGLGRRRLHLLAWTPGTATLWDRPGDRGQRLLTVELATRSTQVELLDV